MARKIDTTSKFLSSEEIKELANCVKDPLYFSNFVHVVHPVRGKVRFELYPYQKSVLYQFLKNRFNIILKFRQAGITELISLYCLWLAMYHPNKKINIISIKDTVAKKVLKKIKYMYKNLPFHLQTPIVNGRSGEYGTAEEVEFSNGSFIASIPTTEDAGRSEGLSLLVIDEAAIIRWASAIWASSFPTLSCISGSYEIFLKKKVVMPRTNGRKTDVIEKVKIKDISPTTKGVNDLYDEELYTVTHKGRWKRINFSQNKGKLLTWKVKDERGNILDCTPAHKLLTPNGWKTTEEVIELGLKVIQVELASSNIQVPPKTIPPVVEELRRIEGFNNYLVSNTGKVFKTSSGKITEVKQHINKRFYYDVILVKDKKTFTRKVSRLVAEAFIGPVPEGYVVDHIDCNKEHNYITNLRIITGSKNIKRSYKYSVGANIGQLINKVDPSIHGLILHLNQTHKKWSHQKISSHLKTKYGLKVGRKTVGNIINNTKVYLSKLVKLEEYMEDIYDINVEGDHSYILPNNFINHNTGGAAIINSTPFGTGGFYHSTWVDAITGKGPVNPLRLYWNMHPERDQKWYDEMSKVLGPKRTAQEIDGDFLSSGNTVFDISDIKAIEDMLSEYPPLVTRFNGQYKQFSLPDRNSEYFIGADCSTGRATDYSSFTVMDKPGEEHAVFKGRIPLNKYGKLLGDVGERFNFATLAPETNDIGMAVTLYLQDEGYPNLYYHKKILKKKGKKRPETEDIPGWLTTSKNRSLIIENLEKDVREGVITVKDPFFCQEAYTFVYDGSGRPVAMGKHNKASSVDIDLEGETYSDDSILGKAITNHVRKTTERIVTTSPQ